MSNDIKPFTIFYEENLNINLLHINAPDPSGARETLHNFERQLAPDPKHDMNIYEFEFVGVIAGHLEWEDMPDDD